MKLRAVDLFCGAGGTSAGAEATGQAQVVFAVNHWQTAVSTHSANFPHCHHVNSRLNAVSPSEAGKFNLLFASPECTHHSRARGGKPTSDQQRSGAWDVMPWLEHHRPAWAVFENVVEFQDWGPVGPTGKPLEKFRGQTFHAWVKAIQSLGYRVEWRVLNAADYGAATSRDRLFVICRKGNRQPVFPKATHADPSLPFFANMTRLPWRAAAEIIDWSIPAPSIFARKNPPLKDKTLLRIEAGLRRFVGPFVSAYHCGQDSARRNHAADAPLPVIDCSNRYALTQPYIFSTQSGGAPRDSGRPVPTITACGGAWLCQPFQVVLRNNMSVSSLADPVGTITAGGRHTGVCVPFMSDVNHGDSGHLNGRSRDLSEATRTVTAKNGKALVVPWIGHYYGTDNQSPVEEPLDTITTKGRHSLCLALCKSPDEWPAASTDAMRKLQATMRSLGIADVGFRMFSNLELSLAQGFHRSYIFHGTSADITRQIGNSVSPNVAKAITQAILSV